MLIFTTPEIMLLLESYTRYQRTFVSPQTNHYFNDNHSFVEGIPELVEMTDQQNETSQEGTCTKKVLANFMKNVLGIEGVKDIEFQEVHRMGKPRMDGSGSRTIIARFLRFPDRGSF